MFKKTLLPFLIIASTLLYPTDYTIKVRLFPHEKILRGEEKIIWENSSGKPIDYLLFHMYLNAFSNEESTFIKETPIPYREKPYFKNKLETGWVKINSIKINGESPNRIYYIQPDDGNLSDKTVLKVELDQPVKPGEKLEISIKFKSKLPKIIARTGWNGKFFMVAQWFPKIGVLEKDGSWNCHQFHRNSEFYSDYGEYSVEITVPEEYIVAGVGVLKDSWNNTDKTKTYLFNQKNIHDFSWSAYPYFKIFKKKISSKNPPVDTTIELYTYDSKEWAISRYFKVVENALKFFSSHFGKYPYRKITVIDPPPGAERAGGMEYPTLITGGRFSNFLSKYILNSIEMVTFHEFGHQYWYGIVGSNEFEFPWLDEGLNTFSEIVGLSEFYGKHTSIMNLKLLGINLGDYDSAVISINTNKYYDRINKFSWKFFDGSSYSFNSYHRTAMTLITLKNLYGDEKFYSALREYFKRYSFKHPKPQDFLQVMKEKLGDFAEFFVKKFIFENGTIDYSIETATTKEKRKLSGIYDNTFIKGGKDSLKDKKVYYSEVKVFRQGVSGIPVEVEFYFENGTKKIFKWNGVERWKKFTFYTYSPLMYAKIDPFNKIAIDRNILNNSKRVKPYKNIVKKYSLTFSLIHALSFLLLPL